MREPRIAAALLRGFISDPALEEAILGDLAEEWNERADGAGGAPARGWYWRQVLLSVPYLVRDWWMRESPVRVFRTLGRVALVLIVAITLAAATTAGMLSAAGGATGQPGSDVTLAVLIAASGWAGVAGFVLALRTADVPMVSAVLLGLSWLPATPLAALAHPTPGPPGWFPALFPTLLFALTVAGGAIATTLRDTGYLEDPTSADTDPSTRERTMKKKTSLFRVVARPVFAAAVLLAVPLAAMQFTGEVAWTPFDFVFMGTLIVGTGVLFELALAKTESTPYRTAAGVALAAGFLLVCLSGAVGIIGAADNAANLMYLGVIAVGIGGAVGAGSRPRGMARAMIATALAQLAVCALALIGGLGGAPNWQIKLIALSVFFAALFLGSAWLFNEAAPTRGRRAEEGATRARQATR